MIVGWRTLVTCVAGCLWWPTWAPAAPSLRIQTTSLDLGTQPPGQSFEHCLELFNAGDQPLQVTGLQTGCECVAAEFASTTLAPGAGSTLALRIDPADLRGEVRRVVEFNTNDPEHRTIRLRLRYRIAGPVTALPADVNLGVLKPGESGIHAVTIQTSSDPFEMRGVESNHRAFEAQIRQPLATPSQPAELEIRYTAPDTPGRLAGRVTGHLAGPGEMSLELPVTATISEDVQFEPPELAFGTIPLGAGRARSLRVTTKTGTRLDAVESSDPLVLVRRLPAEPGGGAQVVEVTVLSQADLGPFRSHVILKTTGRERHHLAIPVHGEVVWSEPAATAPAVTVLPASASLPAATVRIDFPDEVEVQAIVDYVSRTLGVNILYDEAVKGKKLTLRSPEPISKSALLDLLRAILQAKGFVLVDAEQPGWYRIAPNANLASQARIVQEAPSADSATNRVISQVLRVGAANSAKIAASLKSFLTTPGGSMITVEQAGPRHLLIVTDFEPVIATIDRLARLMDTPAPAVEIRFSHARQRDAAELAAEVQRIIGDVARLAGQKDTAVISGDTVTGQLTLIGLPEQLVQAEDLIRQLDSSAPAAGGLTRRYAPRFVNVNRVRGLAEQLFLGSGKEARANVRTIIDAETNSLYVIGPEEIHGQVRALVDELDAAPPESSRPVRYYRPMNRPAAELFETLAQMLGEGGGSRPGGHAESARSSNRGQSAPEQSTAGSHRPSASRGGGAMQALPEPPALRSASQPAEPARPAIRQVSGAEYKLSIDEHTNTIIAVASPELHLQIEQLMKQLDRRRPQVLIEVTIMTLEITDSLGLGMEVESFELRGTKSDFIAFSAFGLSQVNTTNGALTLAPGVGFNGAILSPRELNVVINAVATHGKSHVIARPKILVDDHSSASISSVSESPFTSVNASNTVATTSFAGFAEAGTSLTVQPHINEGDHLQLTYSLTFSSFTGSASNGGTVPPPRSSNTITSVIEIPDGYTAVIGGLQTDRDGDTVSEIPLLGRIPLLGLLFQNSSRTQSQSRLYAFIRPVILRDDRFEDLKFITQADLDRAELRSGDFPESAYQWMP